MPEPAAALPAAGVVGVVVVTHRSGPLTLRCLDALAATTWPGGLRVVLVDNASGDGVADEVEATRPDVHVVRSGVNAGFGAGCDLGFEALGVGLPGGPDHVALVNPDAQVEPGWLAPLVAALEADDGRAAACPLVLFDRPHARLVGVPADEAAALASVVVDGEERVAALRVADGVARVPVEGPGPWSATVRTAAGMVQTVVLADAVDLVQNAGNELAPGWFVVDRGFAEPDGPRWREPAEVFGWSGCAVLLRSAHLVEVGTFDERLFLYYEDTDLAWRARLAGWRHAFVPSSVVRHRVGASTAERSPTWFFHVQRGRLIVLLKHAPPRALLTALAVQVAAPVARRLRPGPPRGTPSRGATPPSSGRRRVAALASVLPVAPRLLAERPRGAAARRARAEVVAAWYGRADGPAAPPA